MSVLRTDLVDLGSSEMPAALRDKLAPPRRRADGFLVVEGLAARTGIQIYSDGKGGLVREYRPAEEVFDAESMASWEGSPFGNQHKGLITPDISRGWTGGAVLGAEPLTLERGDDDWVKVKIVIHDADTIAAVESGSRQLSAGYAVELDRTPGIAPDGTKYDAIQRGIRVNHLARVDRARAGALAQLRMDDDGNVVLPFTTPTPDQEPLMATVKIRLDGATVDVAEVSAPAVEAADAQIAQLRKDRAAIETTAASEKARADVAEQKVEEITRERDTLAGKVTGLEGQVKSDEAIAQLVADGIRARMAVVAEVRPFVKEDTLDALYASDTSEIKRQFVAAHRPDVKLDGRSDDFVDALYGEVLRQRKAGSKGLAATNEGATRPKLTTHADSDALRDTYLKKNGYAFTPRSAKSN